MRALLGLLSLAASLSSAAPLPPRTFAASLTWAAGPALARELALEEDRVLFLAMHFEGEPRSERFLEDTYDAQDVQRLAAQTVNLIASAATHAPRGKPCTRFEGIECADHRDALEWGEATFSASSSAALPQHLWLGPDGRVLLAAPFELDEAELAWCFATALARNGGGAPELPEGARPPRRLLQGKAHHPTRSLPHDRGLTEEELAERLRVMKSSNRPGARRRELVADLFFTDHPDAAEFVEQGLGRGVLVWSGNESLTSSLQLIGRVSPPSFAEVLEKHARDRRPDVRDQTAIALEQMGAASAVKTVRSALSREKEPHIEKNWIRALGATGYRDKGARKQLLKLATREKDDLLRRNAIFALGYLPVDDAIAAALGEHLASESALDRQAAACSMALTREGLFVAPLRESIKSGADDGSRPVLTKALGVLRGAPLHTIEDAVKRLCGDRTPRERVFFRSIGR